MGKSKEYTQDDESKVYFEFSADQKLIGIFKDGSPVDPANNEFTKLQNSDDALNAYRVNKHGGDKNSYESEIQVEDSSLLRSNFRREEQKSRNQQFIQDQENRKALAFQRLKDQREDLNRGTDGRGGRPKGSSQILAYPFNFDRNQDHLKITRHEYRRPDINQSKSGNVTKERNVNIGTDDGIVTESQKYNTAGDTVAGTLLGSVLLPMPKVADVNGVEWGNSELTISGLAALGLARGVSEAQLPDALSGLQGLFGTGKDAIAKLKDAEALEDIKDDGVNIAGSNVSEFTRALKAQTLSGLAGILPGVNLDADTFLARTSGRVLNPNAEVLFQGPVIRDFAFSFIMIARSEKEGTEIRKILRFLKEGMAPKFRSTAFLENPDVFLLEYRNGNGVLNTVNRFNPGGLALQTMSVDYAPNGYWSAYRDSQPVSLKLNLSFKELRPIYQGDQLMTPSDSVGY